MSETPQAEPVEISQNCIGCGNYLLPLAVHKATCPKEYARQTVLGLQDVEASATFETLQGYLEGILNHYKENPKHGAGCSCMDQISWRMRNDIRAVLPTAGRYDGDETENKAFSALLHIWGMITRHHS